MKKALLAVGNPLKGDDGIALYLGKMVEENLKEWKVFYGEDVPEDEIYAIKKYKPDLLVVADAVIGLESPSEFLELSNSASHIYSTHNIPLEILINMIKEDVKNVFFLGINVPKENMTEINPALSKTAINNSKTAFFKIKELDSLLN